MCIIARPLVYDITVIVIFILTKTMHFNGYIVHFLNYLSIKVFLAFFFFFTVFHHKYSDLFNSIYKINGGAVAQW